MYSLSLSQGLEMKDVFMKYSDHIAVNFTVVSVVKYEPEVNQSFSLTLAKDALQLLMTSYKTVQNLAPGGSRHQHGLNKAVRMVT